MTSEQALEILCRRFPEHYAGDIVDYCTETTEWERWDKVSTEEELVEDYLLYIVEDYLLYNGVLDACED